MLPAAELQTVGVQQCRLLLAASVIHFDADVHLSSGSSGSSSTAEQQLSTHDNSFSPLGAQHLLQEKLLQSFARTTLLLLLLLLLLLPVLG
jgi:hypothetical protein